MIDGRGVVGRQRLIAQKTFAMFMLPMAASSNICNNSCISRVWKLTQATVLQSCHYDLH